MEGTKCLSGIKSSCLLFCRRGRDLAGEEHQLRRRLGSLEEKCLPSPAAEQPPPKALPSCRLGWGQVLPSWEGAGQPGVCSGCKGCISEWDLQGATPEKPERKVWPRWVEGAQETCRDERCHQQ